MHKLPSTAIILALATTASPAMAAGAVCDAVWHDAPRGRDVPVRIRMSEGAGKAPVILFSHGLGGSLDAGTTWAKAWVEAGFIVIHLQHPGSDRAILGQAGDGGRGGRLRMLRRLRQGGETGNGAGNWAADALKAAMTPEQLEARVGDVKFVLDQIARRPREGECGLGRADLSRVGMSGHSFGAHTTQALAGQKFAKTTTATADPRITASTAFSPSPPMTGSDAAVMADVRKPFFSVTGTEDTTPAASGVYAADRERPFRAMPPGDKYLLVIAGGTHANFSGNERGGFRRQAPSEHLTHTVVDATTAFWRWTLTGDIAAKRLLTEASGIQSKLDSGDKFESR